MVAAPRAPRVVCVGSNLESETVLRRLIASQVNVVGLVTRPAADPGGASDYCDLHPLCEEHGIRVVDTIDINAPDTVTDLEKLEPEYVFTLGWSQLFGEGVLAVPSGFVVGSHPSPLPVGRGRAPVSWTILEGLETSAVSLFRMNSGVDAGAILLQIPFDVPPRVYAAELYRIVAMRLAEAFAKLHGRLARGEWSEREQDLAQGTVRAKRTPADGWIDFQRPAEDLDRLIRAVSEPYPGAYAYYEGRKFTIWKCDPSTVTTHRGVTGQILKKSKERVLVQCGSGTLWLSDVRAPDGRSALADLVLGSRFGFRIEDELHELRRQVEMLRER